MVYITLALAKVACLPNKISKYSSSLGVGFCFEFSCHQDVLKLQLFFLQNTMGGIAKHFPRILFLLFWDIEIHCKFSPHENYGNWELQGPCRENLHYLWKRWKKILRINQHLFPFIFYVLMFGPNFVEKTSPHFAAVCLLLLWRLLSLL